MERGTLMELPMRIAGKPLEWIMLYAALMLIWKYFFMSFTVSISSYPLISIASNRAGATPCMANAGSVWIVFSCLGTLRFKIRVKASVPINSIILSNLRLQLVCFLFHSVGLNASQFQKISLLKIFAVSFICSMYISKKWTPGLQLGSHFKGSS